jgi:glycerate dehydrogenase
MTQSQHHVVFLERATLPPETVLRSPAFAHSYEEYAFTAPQDTVARASRATILLVNKLDLGAEVIDRLPDLQFIAVAATGVDRIDLAACAARGVRVSNIRSYAVNTVPEHTFALMLALRRSLVGYRASVQAGRWAQSGQFCYFDYPVHDLGGSTLGIVGEGALGQSVASIARGFGMNVLFAAHKGSTGMGPLYTPFETVLEQSDVITLHCPLSAQTRNLLGSAEFARMKKRPLIINAARGGLVDEQALADALLSGQISGAGFDVVTQEPIPDDHPFMRLLDQPNFILTPHVAWSSREATQALADQLIDNVEAFVRGEPTNCVI